MDVGGTCFAVLIAGKEDEVHIPIAHTCQYVNGGTGRLVEKSFVCGAVKRTDSLIFRSNVWLVAIAVALLPVAGWIFMFSCGKMTLLLWFVVTCICLGVVLVLVWSGLRMRVSYMENKGTGILFYFLEQYPRPFVLTIFNPIKYVRSVF